MASLEQAYLRARKEGSGYERLFGNAALARLVSSTQGAVISSGFELEHLILERAQTINNLDDYLSLETIPEGVFAVPKKQIKKSKISDATRIEPDFLLFEKKGKAQNCYIVELKDGDQFDTKKASGERESLHAFMNAIAPHLQFKTSIHVCFFHARTRQEIVTGFKKRITEQEALTGPEFCEILGVHYEEILKLRQQSQQTNFEFFVQTMLTIPEVQDLLNNPAKQSTRQETLF